MTDRDRDDRRLRSFFREVHRRTDPPAPPFRIPGPARARRPAPRARLWPAGAAAVAGTLLVAAALVFVTRTSPGPSGLDDAQALRLADALGAWEAPLDFLLETPGLEYYGSPPAFDTTVPDLSGDAGAPQTKEIGS